MKKDGCKMNVLIMTQYYAPEDVSTAVLMTDLATDLAKHGHQVTVVTGAPSYPYGHVFQGYRNRPYQAEWLQGVRVVRTWSYISPLRSFWHRISNYGTFSLSSFLGGLLADKPDVIIIDSPPLPLGLSAWLLSRFRGVPWVLHVEDIWPEEAIQLGVLSNKTAIAFLLKMESFLYRTATRILVISEGFRRNLLGKGVPDEKISVIPVWADPDIVNPMPKENSFRVQHGLSGKFVVMYAGNIGLTSSPDDVLESAELLRDQPDISFVIVGEGVRKVELETIAKNKGLENLIFLPYQPREMLSELLAAADISLVTLNRSSSKTSLPSKTFSIMASARPILAISPSNSELAALVQEIGCGINVPPEKPKLLVEAILKLKNQSEVLVVMGQNGRIQLENRFSRARCVNEYENMLLELCKKSSKLHKESKADAL
jgi:colanic acid biosynthesis glycosyl transferase WcaI